MCDAPEPSIALSVIVPVYNVEEYLESCIRSILAQRMEFKEIILVNDGSTDRSFDICQRFANEFDCIRLISKSNGGLSSARNVGLGVARGAYVSFVDSDDVLVSDCLEELHGYCIEHDLDLLRFGYSRIDEFGEECISPPAERAYYSQIRSGLDFLRNEVNAGAYEVVAWAGLYRRKYLAAHSIEFAEGRTHEDHEFFLRCLLSDPGVRVMRVDRPVYGYRVRAGSITKSPAVRNIVDITENTRSMVGFIRDLQLDPVDERLAMRAASTLYYQLTSVYGRLGHQERIRARTLLDDELTSLMMKFPFDPHQRAKLLLFRRARWFVELVYWAKWRGQHG